MARLNGKTGCVATLGIEKIQGTLDEFGLPDWDPSKLNRAIELTEERIRGRLDLDLADAVTYGAFSYLAEIIPLVPNLDCCVSLALAFTEWNQGPDFETFSREALERFGEMIRDNGFSWDDLLVAFLDSEAAKQDRLRQNLALTVSERYNRHNKLMGQLRRAKFV